MFKNLQTSCLFIILAVSVQADWRIDFQLLSYSNPNFLLANGRCCSNDSLTSNCPSACEDRLKIDVTSFDDPSGDNPLASIGTSNISPRVLVLPTIEGPWPLDEGVNLVITVTDRPSEELVDNFTLSINGTPSDALSPPKIAQGEHELVELRYAFRIVCLSTFFGDACDTVCIERNDSSGHFSCGSDGSIVCLQGYRNVTTNCTECDVADGCSEEGGFCEGPGECVCREGYSGTNCTIAPTTSTSTFEVTSTLLPPLTSDITVTLTSSPESTMIITPTPSSSPLTTKLIMATTPLVSTQKPGMEVSTPLITPALPTGNGGLSPSETTGLTFGVIIAIVLLVLIVVAMAAIVFFYILKRQHRRKARRWYLTESTTSTTEAAVLANKYASGTRLIPHNNGMNNGTSSPQVETKSVHTSLNTHWYQELEPPRFRDDQVAPAYDTETAFSDATFDTLSRRSAADDNGDTVVYADVVQPKVWITSDGGKDEEESASDDQEIQVSMPPSQRINYAEVTFEDN